MFFCWFIFDEINTFENHEDSEKISSLNEKNNEDGVVHIYSIKDEWFSNLGFIFEIDTILVKFFCNLKKEDFQYLEEYKCYLDNETQSLAISVHYHPFVNVNNVEKEVNISDWPYKDVNWGQSNMKDINIINFYIIRITTIDVMLNEQENIDKHDVKSHLRRLKGGKLTQVKSHIKKNPRRVKEILNSSLVENLVYATR